MVAVQLVDAIEHTQCRANRTLRVVAVRDRSTEHRHHGIPDELLERAAVVLDPVLRVGVVELESVAHVLRVGPVAPRSEAHQVDEQDRDELPLLTECSGRFEPSAAATAEARLRRVRLAAAWARDVDSVHFPKCDVVHAGCGISGSGLARRAPSRA